MNLGQKIWYMLSEEMLFGTFAPIYENEKKKIIKKSKLKNFERKIYMEI